MTNQQNLKAYRNQDLGLPLAGGLNRGAQLVAMGHAVAVEARIMGGNGLKTRLARAIRKAARPVVRSLGKTFRRSEAWKRTPAQDGKKRILVGHYGIHQRRGQWLTYKSIASAVTRSG